MAAFVLFFVLIALADSCDVCKKKRDEDHHDRPTHWDEGSQSSSHIDVNQNNIHIDRPRDDDCHEKREGHCGHHGHCVGHCNKCCTKPIIRNACSRVEGVNVPFASLTGIYEVSHMCHRDRTGLQNRCPFVVLSAKDHTTCEGSFASYVRDTTATPTTTQISAQDIIYSCGHFTHVDLSCTPPRVLNGVIVKQNHAGLAVMVCDNIEADGAIVFKAVLVRNKKVPASEVVELKQCLDRIDTTSPLLEVNQLATCPKAV